MIKNKQNKFLNISEEQANQVHQKWPLKLHVSAPWLHINVDMDTASPQNRRVNDV